MQGSDVEAFASQPGLVQTELNGRKRDHRKLTAISVDIAAKIMGKDARSASLCLQRPAAEPTVTGVHPLLLAIIVLPSIINMQNGLRQAWHTSQVPWRCAMLASNWHLG